MPFSHVRCPWSIFAGALHRRLKIAFRLVQHHVHLRSLDRDDVDDDAGPGVVGLHVEPYGDECGKWFSKKSAGVIDTKLLPSHFAYNRYGVDSVALWIRVPSSLGGVLICAQVPHGQLFVMNGTEIQRNVLRRHPCPDSISGWIICSRVHIEIALKDGRQHHPCNHTKVRVNTVHDGSTSGFSRGHRLS